MKNLESKRNTGKWGSSTQAVERQYLPLNLAVREAYFKGSLLDRVASLENRLFQVKYVLDHCLIIDSVPLKSIPLALTCLFLQSAVLRVRIKQHIMHFIRGCIFKPAGIQTRSRLLITHFFQS